MGERVEVGSTMRYVGSRRSERRKGEAANRTWDLDGADCAKLRSLEAQRSPGGLSILGGGETH